MLQDFDLPLEISNKYTKKDLANILGETNLSLVREGIYYCKNSPNSLLFVDLEKQGKENRFHFNDFFDDEPGFYRRINSEGTYSRSEFDNLVYTPL